VFFSSLVSADPYPRPWTPESRRTGVVGMKMGMMSVWDYWGKRLPITVVKIDNCQVIQVKKELDKKGYVGLQVGSGSARIRTTTKPLLVHYNRAGVEPKRRVAEFRVSTDALLPARWQISARHFVPGQYVDVTGITIGKGFQGPMKRWGFGGLPATHGVSLAHRSHGSTGGRQDPGRVWKGKKMAGRMGCDRVVMQNLQVYKIDCKRDLLYLIGSVPGYAGNWVLVKDAIKTPFEPENPPPFPTWIRTSDEDDTIDEIIMSHSDVDPVFERKSLA